ncbi:MAG: hypothetical protein LAT75_02680 [Candidatus Cyclonatronum sp.]|uniref:hypothetical protein n=1 Tax=Cyclonatronum sp. TaxID=3024185 RepID=UPI0025C2DD72|nr:hypothetical protein [Cyclonatronum sp.]MCH8485741.1 hypothetical protein [Cyclonatronum sp.]
MMTGSRFFPVPDIYQKYQIIPAFSFFMQGDAESLKLWKPLKYKNPSAKVISGRVFTGGRFRSPDGFKV